MTDIQYLPIATVEVAPDGTCTLAIDWSSSEQGEHDPETAEHTLTPLSTRVTHLLEAWIRSNGGGEGEQRIDIGRLAPEPAAQPATRYVIGAEHMDANGDQPYWLGGVWTTDGHLAWSSEPESFETEALALASAYDHLALYLANTEGN